MIHLNLAAIRFKAFSWSFCESMDWYGHDQNKCFLVQVPREIEPIIAEAEGQPIPTCVQSRFSHPMGMFALQPRPIYVLPPSSFNVVKPFKIIPAISKQEGTLLFGVVGCGQHRFEVVEGQDLILYSEQSDFHNNHQIVFAAVLRSDQRIVVHTKAWIDSANSHERGSQDQATMFSVSGVVEMPWKVFLGRLRDEREKRKAQQEMEETKRNLENGSWTLA